VIVIKNIGQFAKENDVTVKTLHYYEKIDLIKPMEVDPMTGYRFYGEKEALDLKIVLFLKTLGLSLSEIKEIIEQRFNLEELITFFSFKKEQSLRDKENAMARTHKLSTIIDILQNKENQNYDYKELISMSEKVLHTGKYGRGEFIEKSERLFNEAKQNQSPLSVVQMDLDKFHYVNKEFGYDVGDVVLERTQNEIVGIVQKSRFESIVERKGGDEFSITIKATPNQTKELVDEMINRVKLIDYSDLAENLSVSISAGMAFINKDVNHYVDLVHQATIELFEYKRKNL
jgi:diguanylate cyclase (GGDEF)-like protein